MTRDELLAEIARAVRHAFPDRAESILRELEKRVPREDARDLDRFYAGVARDRLTGVWARRVGFLFLQLEIQRRRDEPVPVSALMIDLDRLQRVNYEHGHAVGDVVLQSVARTIVSAARPSDVVSRTGGEEFLVILPETIGEVARRVAEKIRAAVEAAPIAVDGATLRMTVSIGIGVVAGLASAGEREEDTFADVLRAADDGVNEAKLGGRNRVVGRSD